MKSISIVLEKNNIIINEHPLKNNELCEIMLLEILNKSIETLTKPLYEYHRMIGINTLKDKLTLKDLNHLLNAKNNIFMLAECEQINYKIYLRCNE